MTVPGTLSKTILERSACEDHAFLVAFETTTIAPMIFINITPATGCDSCLCQHGQAEFFGRFAVEPVQDAHPGYVILVILGIIQLVILLAADTKAAIPVDLYLIPGRVTKDFLFRIHVVGSPDQPSHKPRSVLLS